MDKGMPKDNDPKNHPLTIKDIASLAGVSPSTVSLVLNKKPGVAEKTRTKVLRIAQHMGFSPNMVARSLVQRRTKTIGMMIPNVRNTIFPDMALEVDRVARHHGYFLSLISTYDDPHLEALAIENIKTRGLDGIISSSALLGTNNIPNLVSTGFPVVCVLRRVYDCPLLDYVVADAVKGGYLATEHLIRMGHQRIAVLRGPENISASRERYEGALLAAHSYGMTLPKELMTDGPFLQERGYKETLQFLKKKPSQRPTAVFGCNDDLALGAFEAVIDAGFRVGQDVAVVGFNNISSTALRNVAITTICPHSSEMGLLAALRLIKRLENRDKVFKPYHKVLEPELIVRDSCGYQAGGGYTMERRPGPLFNSRSFR